MSTDIDTHDELPVPHLEERLWAELADLHAARGQEQDQEPEPGGGPAAPVRRLTAPRPARRSLLVGAGAIAAAAALVVGIVVTQSGDGSSPGRSPHTTAPANDLGARIIAAMEEAGQDSIRHSVSRFSAAGRTYEEWVDHTTATYRRTTRDAAGTLLQEEGGRVLFYGEDQRPGEYRTVTHCDRTYEEVTQYEVDLTGVWDGLEEGSLIEDGTEVIDGRRLTHVRSSEPEISDMFQVWLDPATNLPVRLEYRFGPNQVTETVEYLPRSQELLDQLVPPPVPEGYESVDVDAGEGRTPTPDEMLQLGLGPVCPS